VVRRRNNLHRNKKQRASYDRALIVCEGSKTEPSYFGEIRSEHRLHTANIQIRPSEYGTSPLQVVQYAYDLFINGDPHREILPKDFDHVFVVIDRDDHLNYHDALQLANSLHNKLTNNLKQKVGFRIIASVPSFELWLLLHFEDVLHPIHRNEVVKRLKKHLPNYTKNTQGIFITTRSKIDSARQRALSLAKNYDAYDGKEPYTNVHELIDFLVALRS